MNNNFKIGNLILKVKDNLFPLQHPDSMEEVCIVVKIGNRGLEANSLQTGEFRYGNFNPSCFREVKLKELSFKQMVQYKNVKETINK